MSAGRDPAHHHGPLAGLTAAGAVALFAIVLLLLAWHQVSGHVSLAITMLAYVFIAALSVTFGAFTWLAVAWVRHRVRNPELLSGRRPAPAAEPAPQAITAAWPAAIEPPRMYLNVTDDQLEAIMQALPGRNEP